MTTRMLRAINRARRAGTSLRSPGAEDHPEFEAILRTASMVSASSGRLSSR